MSIHPESRGFAFLVRATVDGVRDADFAIIGGAGAPSGGVTPTGQSLASTQNGLYCRSDGTDYDEGLYLTLDGGTTWKPAMFNGGSFTIEDTEALKFGTPGTDIVFTADGTDVVVTGTGDLNFVDSVDVSWGTGKDLGIVHDGANSLIANTTGELQIDSAGAVSVESSAGALNVGADAVAQALNLGTGAAARVISIGNAASASMALDAGVGGLTAQADTDIEIDAGTSLNLECSGGTIRVGADNVAQAVAVGTAGARVITVGSAAAASLDLDAGVGAATIQADTTIDIDAGTALGIESAGGAISIGADAVAQTLNLGTGAAARQINIGNPASAGLAMEAGVGLATLRADTSIAIAAGTTLELDATGSATLESSADAISVGADAVAQAVNIATGAAARVITIGNAASASLDMDAGVGGATLQADTTVDIDSGTTMSLNVAAGQTLNIADDAVAQAVVIGNAASASIDMDAGVGGFTAQADTTLDLDAGTTLSINTLGGQTLNIANDAVAQAVVIGNAATASIAMDAGVGAFSVLADTTVDIDAGTALGIESAGGAISIGADAVAQAVNIATGAAARVITVGNAASASLALEAGVGAMTANADTSIGLNAGTTLDLDAAGAASLESSAGAINVGADNVAQPVNLATGAAARVITLGNAASASIDIDAGVGGFTAQADTTLDLDAGTTLSINTLGGQTLNIGNDAVAQVITIGNAASNGLAMEAGVGAASITADTTIDLDAAGAIGIESSAAAINVGADAVAQPVNIATGAAARVIAIGNALSASLDMDAGVGGLTAQADTTVDVTAGTELGLEAGTRLSLASTPSRLRGFNRLSDRYELSWVAGEDGLVQLNASAAYAVSRHFEILGTNASDDDVTVSPEGGLIFETDGADGDEVIVLPHLTAGLSPWTSTTWGTDKRVAWECDFTSGPNVTNCIIWAGLKLTNGEAKGVDADSVFFRYEDDVAAGNWEVVYSNTAGETSTDTGVAGALSTRYHLKLVINNDRTVSCYLNGALVETTDALDNTTDLIPYIGVATDGAGPGANKSIILHGQSILRTIG